MAHKTFPPFNQRNAPKTKDIFQILRKKSELLENRLTNPKFHISAAEIADPKKSNVKNLLGGLDLKMNHRTNSGGKTFKGLYAWARLVKGKPVVKYIGISQNLEKRLKAHISSKNKSTASWVYMMAKDEFYKSKGITTSSPKKEIDLVYWDFKEQGAINGGKYDFHLREEIQKRLIEEKYFCTVVLVEDDYELYMLELFCSLKFESHWNVFQTH